MADTKYIVRFKDGNMIAYDNIYEYNMFNGQKFGWGFLLFIILLSVMVGLLFMLLCGLPEIL